MSFGTASLSIARLGLFAAACCAAQPVSTVNPCPNAKPVPAALRIPADLNDAATPGPMVFRSSIERDMLQRLR